MTKQQDKFKRIMPNDYGEEIKIKKARVVNTNNKIMKKPRAEKEYLEMVKFGDDRFKDGYNKAKREKKKLIDDELRFLLAILQKRSMGFNCVRCDELIKNRTKQLQELKDKEKNV